MTVSMVKKNGRGGARPGAGRPKGGTGRKKKPVQFTLMPELLEKMSEEARRRGITRTRLLESLLAEFFEGKEKNSLVDFFVDKKTEIG